MTSPPIAETHVVLGAGPLGRATAAALRNAGRRVLLVNRAGVLTQAPAGVELYAGDLAAPQHLARNIGAAAAVYFCAQPPYHRWPQQFPALQAAAIDIAARLGARLIVAENLYGYGPVDGPIAETQPLRPNSRKGRVRAAMHETLMDAHATGKVRAVVARGSDFFGPFVDGSAMGARAFAALCAGRPVEVIGHPDALHSYTYVEDFAAALAILGSGTRVLGEVWHVPNAPAVSTRRFVEIAARLAGQKAAVRRMGVMEMTTLGVFIPAVREMIEMRYAFQTPLVVDHGKFASVFGDISTPLESALARTIDWTRNAER